LIAPHLAFCDLDEITLLGTNAWNSPSLVEQAGEYVRDAIFVDGFFAESAIPYVRDFVENYERAFQREPRVLEAQGYDSLRILEEAFYEAALKTRDHVREAILEMDGYSGLSGYTRFDDEGCATKRLYLLSIRQNRIEQIY
jgi:ABC-type branched-subunit amino acid transport system substrate-binding protein